MSYHSKWMLLTFMDTSNMANGFLEVSWIGFYANG